MRVLVLQDFGVMAIEERTMPTAGPGEVLLRVVATGICGSDIHGFTGENGRRSPGQVMGHEAVGIIQALGAGVEGLETGTTATFNPVVVPDQERAEYVGREQHAPGKYVIGVRADRIAAFAEHIVVPARNVVVLAPEMPALHGALVEPLAVAVHAVRRAAVRAEQKVLVLGGGPIGQSVVLALRMHGVKRIVVTEVSQIRRNLLTGLGALALDPTTDHLTEQVQRALGSLADLTMDAVGVDATMADALRLTKMGGSICLVGMGSPRLSIDAYEVSTQERTIVGSFTYSDRDFTDAAQWLSTVPDLAGQLITRQVELEEAPETFTRLASGEGTAGKTLVALNGLP